MSLMTPATLVPIPAKCTADWVRRKSLAICCHPVSAPTLSLTICLKVPYVGVLTNCATAGEVEKSYQKRNKTQTGWNARGRHKWHGQKTQRNHSAHISRIPRTKTNTTGNYTNGWSRGDTGFAQSSPREITSGMVADFLLHQSVYSKVVGHV